jgi:hypothetical protein
MVLAMSERETVPLLYRMTADMRARFRRNCVDPGAFVVQLSDAFFAPRPSSIDSVHSFLPMIRRAGIALFLFSLLAVAAVRAADFTGRWEGLATLPDGTQFKVTFVFTETGGKLTGSVETSEYGNFAANELVVQGDTISFNVTTDGGIYTNTGKLKPEGLLMEGKGPDGPLTPVLYKRSAVDLTGKWRGKVETPDGPAEIVYTFELRDGKPSGTVSSPMGVAPLTNITIDGNRVAFESDLGDFTIKRRGTVVGDTMQLTVSINGNEVSATFTREPVAMP